MVFVPAQRRAPSFVSLVRAVQAGSPRPRPQAWRPTALAVVECSFAITPAALLAVRAEQGGPPAARGHSSGSGPHGLNPGRWATAVVAGAHGQASVEQQERPQLSKPRARATTFYYLGFPFEGGPWSSAKEARTSIRADDLKTGPSRCGRRRWAGGTCPFALVLGGRGGGGRACGAGPWAGGPTPAECGPCRLRPLPRGGPDRGTRRPAPDWALKPRGEARPAPPLRGGAGPPEGRPGRKGPAALRLSLLRN